jgi:hypothetical protein
VITKIRTPGGGFVARLRGPDDSQARTIGVLVRLVGSACPPSASVPVAIDAVDDGGESVEGKPDSLTIECPLGRTGGNNQKLDVIYRAADNCDSGELSKIEITATIPDQPGVLAGDSFTVDKNLLCRP